MEHLDSYICYMTVVNITNTGLYFSNLITTFLRLTVSQVVDVLVCNAELSYYLPMRLHVHLVMDV